MVAILVTPNSWILYHKIKENCAMFVENEKHEIKDCESKRNIYVIDLERNQIIELKLRKELEKYGEVKL